MEFLLDYVYFLHWFERYESIETQSRQIDRDEFVVDNQFCNCPTNRWCLLNSVATEACGEQKIRVIRVIADNSVLVEFIEFVKTGPGRFHLKLERISWFYVHGSLTRKLWILWKKGSDINCGEFCIV